MSRASTSLPEPAGPLIMIRLPVGATRSTICRNCDIFGELPTNSSSPPARNRNSCVFAPQTRRLDGAAPTNSRSRSVLNGFSMKS